jgi:hypothetical protein
MYLDVWVQLYGIEEDGFFAGVAGFAGFEDSFASA